jgi:hypothetical protein
VRRIVLFILSLFLFSLLLTCSEDPPITPANQLWFVSPKGGEKLLKGDIVFIRWDFKGSNVKLIKLFYSIDGGNHWVTISDSIPAIPKEYAWNVLVQGTNSLRFRISTTKLFCETGNIIVDDSYSQGIITGLLRGDGRLVPNRKYGGFQVDLLQNGNIIYKDTTNEIGQFTFTGLWLGTFQLKATADFGNENIAYANDIYKLTDTILAKDLVLDSVKYDFCNINVGNKYTFFTKYQSPINYVERNTKISITHSNSSGENIYYYFDGIEMTSTDSILFTGYLLDSNSQVNCTIVSGGSWGADALRLRFRAVHIYDGSNEMNEFLVLGNSGNPTINYGDLIIVKNQSFSTLSMYKYYSYPPQESIKYNFSPELGLVFSEWTLEYNGYTIESIALVDYNF